MRFFGKMESGDGTIVIVLDESRMGIESAELLGLGPDNNIMVLAEYEYQSKATAEQFVQMIENQLRGGDSSLP